MTLGLVERFLVLNQESSIAGVEESAAALTLISVGLAFQLLGYALTVRGIVGRLDFFGEGHVLHRLGSRLGRMRERVAGSVRSAPGRVRAWWRRVKPVVQHFTTPWGWRRNIRHGRARGVVAMAGTARATASASPATVRVTSAPPSPDLRMRVVRLENASAKIREDLAATTATLEEHQATTAAGLEAAGKDLDQLRAELREVFDGDVKTTLLGAALFGLGLIASYVGAIAF